LGIALEKAAKSPLFPLNLRLLSQKLKSWESLDNKKFVKPVVYIFNLPGLYIKIINLSRKPINNTYVIFIPASIM
jgi:hypothetical protein